MKEINSFPLPVVHLNGTGRDTLLSGYTEALKSAKETLKNLMSIEFHARDYYVIDAEAYYEAREVREMQFKNLKEFIHYLEVHILAIQ